VNSCYAAVVRASCIPLVAVLSLAGILAGCPPTPCCTVDTDCGDGRMCVDDVCTVPCTSDDGCKENEVCAATRSSEASGRFCVRPGGHPTGVCPTPEIPDAGGPSDGGAVDGGTECAPDTLEPNNGRPSATNLVGTSVAHRGLSMCAADEDWFVIDLLPGETALVEISFQNALGDLDLFAYQGDADAPFLTSTSTEDTESLSIPAVGGRVFIQVFGWNGATNPNYGLSFTRSGGGPCLDGNEPNDTRTSATPLWNGTNTGVVAGAICTSSDRDVFRLDHFEGASLAFRLSFDVAAGDLRFDVFTAAGVFVGSGEAITEGRAGGLWSLPGTLHYVDVYGANGATNSYTLSYLVVETNPCGNGVIDIFEQCDDGNRVDGDGCSSTCQIEIPAEWTCFPAFYADGTCDCGCEVLDLDCTSLSAAVCGFNNCPAGETIAPDDNRRCVPPGCGDGILNPGEQCDDGNLVSGDGCSSSCQVEPQCGNGVLNPGEQCDDGNLTNGDGCSSTCTLEMTPLCGNGVLNPGEQCDDGNLTNGDGCSSMCTLEAVAVCGNGILQAGEQCDDGNLVPGDGCSPQCTLENPGQCGNGTLDPGEQCDDGNLNAGDGCSPFCSNEFPPTCGNGILDGFEQCDDGNNVAGDGCSPFCVLEVPATWTCPPWYYDSDDGCDCGCGALDPDCPSLSANVCLFNNCPNGAPPVIDDNTRCMIPTCGNGVINPPFEECDDGNLVGGDGCSANCQNEVVCGNGIVEGFEQCDDGNLVGGDGCTPGCTLEVGICGNGVVEPPFEQCDDGNNVDGDGCSSFCTFEFAVCGNGIVEFPFEQCDDGNNVDGDGCSSFCTNEAPIGWTCPVFWYGDNLCDCGCAVIDVDCPSLSSSVCEFNNCPGVQPLPNFNPQCALTSCGNGTVEPPFEQCDDGNLTNGDGCNLNCQFEPICGNGVVEGFEQCDDGNLTNGDGCSSACQFEPGICGNGIVEFPFEQCDDGNTIDGDGCSSFCFFENSFCGNGIVEFPFEQCDDGNTIDGDGCSSFCLFEGPGEWICFPEWFGDGICDCGCGATDIDCPDTSIDVCQFNNCQAPQIVDPSDNSQCIDITCADDFFEENDDPQSASAIVTSTLTNAVLCPNDPDFFVFDAPANVDVAVTLQYTAPPQMTLRVSRPGVGIIDTVSGGGGNLVINFFSTTAGPVIVRVTGASVGAGVPRPYAVTAFVDGGGQACIDDAFEPNDAPPGTGPLFLPADVAATSCPNNPDFYTLFSSGTTSVSVTLTSPTAGGLFFAAFSSDFTLLATGAANAGTVSVTLPAAGAFAVVVAGGAGDTYTLGVVNN
jgi:cysteine-rich repeat protein